MRLSGSIIMRHAYFHFRPTDVERLVLHPDRPTKHIHHKANSIGSGHASEDHAFLQAVAQSIADAGAVLVTGPANAKTELVKHISQHDPRLMRIIVGVETVERFGVIVAIPILSGLHHQY